MTSSLLSQKNILYIADYEFEGKYPKNRYVIILNNNGDENIIIETVTKKKGFNLNIPISHGPNYDLLGHIDLYHFSKDVQVGENGFKFPKDSYLTIGSIFDKNVDFFLNKYGNKLCKKCVMLKSEFIEVVDFLYKSKHTPKKFKLILEEILFNIC